MREDPPEGTEGDPAPITSLLGEAFMFTLEGGGLDNRELRALLDWTVRPRLLPIRGVADVNSLGGEVRTYEVRLDPAALEARGAGPSTTVVSAIENSNRKPGDRIVRNDEVLLVRIDRAARDDRGHRRYYGGGGRRRANRGARRGPRCSNRR
ncbi:MAG: efflux RND transporter permease subunit [Planctomycetota bacterium]